MAEEAKTEALRAGILMLAGVAAGSQQLSDVAAGFDRALSRVSELLCPWLTTGKTAGLQTGAQLWRDVYGDPDDPKVKRRIAKQIATIKKAASGG